MAKHQITINIVNKQTKEEEKREKLDRATGKVEEKSPSDKLQEKQSKKSGKPISNRTGQQIISATTHITTNTVRSATSLISGVGDYTVEANKLNALISVGTDAVNMGVTIGKIAKGKGGWITLIVQAIDYVTGAVNRRIEWENQQTINNIEAERASNRLGIVSTAGNRNMKL